MHSTLWAGDRPNEDVHWSRRDTLPITAVALWVAGVIATALGLFALQMVGF